MMVFFVTSEYFISSQFPLQSLSSGNMKSSFFGMPHMLLTCLMRSVVIVTNKMESKINIGLLGM